MKLHKLVPVVILGLCVLVGSAAAFAQTPDVFKINYFANNGVSGAPDATVRIDNPGSFSEDTAAPVASGPTDLCAMIYVFDNDQQLSECCGCLVTPNGLRTLSVRKDLTSNPLTSVVPNNGTIEIFTTLPNNAPCDITSEFIIAPTARAWASHIQNKVGSAYPITETAFTDATLSGEEVDTIAIDCDFAHRLGSGKGVCTCGTGD
jgi:hypothetical protein